MKHAEITDQIIKSFYKVYNKLGYGFLEKVYENALLFELKNCSFTAQKQQRIEVFYEGHKVVDYFADLIVEDCVIVELKAAEGIRPEHEAQLLNYLRATQIEVGLLLNFGTKPQFKRKVYSNH